MSTETKKKAGRPPKNKTVTEENKVVNKVEEVKEQTIVQKPKKVVKKRRDLNEMIDVKCIVHGGLNYITIQGFEVVWDSYGDIYPLEYKELIHMMNKYKRFFTEPWIIVEQDVLEDLHATHFYKNLIDYDDIDSVFTKTPEQVRDILSKAPDGTKRLIADRATDALRKGTLDSVKVIDVLQKELNIELI